MSIIGEKYEKFASDGDWINGVLADKCMVQKTKEVKVKDDDGNESTETRNDGKPVIDIEALFDLAERNGINARERYAEQVGQKNATGRIRMSLGNMLRSRARKRHGLYDAAGEWMKAPKGFTEGHDKTESPDGESLVKKQAKKEKADA